MMVSIPNRVLNILQKIPTDALRRELEFFFADACDLQTNKGSSLSRVQGWPGDSCFRRAPQRYIKKAEADTLDRWLSTQVPPYGSDGPKPDIFAMTDNIIRQLAAERGLGTPQIPH